MGWGWDGKGVGVSVGLGVQGESAIKKLARGDVPPFLLKSVEIGGPQTAFAFLKMWKLASQCVANQGPGHLRLEPICTGS